MLVLSGIVVSLLFVNFNGDAPAVQEQQITFSKSKAKRSRHQIKENVDMMNQLQGRGAIGTEKGAYAGSTTFRAPALKRSSGYSRSYISTSETQSVQNTGVMIADNSFSYGHTSGSSSSGDNYSSLAPVSGGSARINSVSVGQMFYTPQATNNGSFTGVNRAYTSTMVEIGAPISALSAATFTGAHTHVDLDGDGYCDGNDGFYLDYRPGDGTGEWIEVWVPLGDETPLLVMCLLSLVIAYFKFRK